MMVDMRRVICDYLQGNTYWPSCWQCYQNTAFRNVFICKEIPPQGHTLSRVVHLQ